jgi:hypothetical protein
VKWERIAIVFVIAVSAATFLIPAFRMPDIPQAVPLTVQAPQADAGIAVQVGYMIVSGLLAGFSPLLFLASLFMGVLLFVYNKSRISRYARYYIVGALVIFFAFEYQMTMPGGIEPSLFGFQMMMILALLSLLLALLALEFSPGFAERAARNESVRVSYFIFIGALVALVIVLYGGGTTTPVIAYAASTGHGLIELLIYNLCAMVPSAALFAVLTMNRISLHTRLANNRESILLIGTIILVISVLVVEVVSLLS